MPDAARAEHAHLLVHVDLHTDVVFDEAAGGGVVRPADPKMRPHGGTLRAARGVADTTVAANEIMQPTRGEDDGSG